MSLCVRVVNERKLSVHFQRKGNRGPNTEKETAFVGKKNGNCRIINENGKENEGALSDGKENDRENSGKINTKSF
jgi:hypothetical protein